MLLIMANAVASVTGSYYHYGSQTTPHPLTNLTPPPTLLQATTLHTTSEFEYCIFGIKVRL